MVENDIKIRKAQNNNNTQKQTGSITENNNPMNSVFGSNDKVGQVPYKQDGPKIPSIYDFNKNGYQLPYKSDETPIVVPYMDATTRKNYDKSVIVGLFKGFCNENITENNTKEIIQNLNRLDTQNYKLAFGSFEAAGITLPDLVMRSPHLNAAEKKKCLNHLIELGKKTADYGQQRSDDVIPGMKKIMENADKKNVMTNEDRARLVADFKKIVNRQDTLTTPKPDIPNGKFDGNFSQGRTGDCWLLAGTKALSTTPQGRKLLDDAVTIDKNGNATVNLKGVGKKYTITARDLKCSNELSTGDSDVRALEIAMDRYFRETVDEGSADIDGNTVGKAFNLLVGKDKTYQMGGTRDVHKGISFIRSANMKDMVATTGIGGNVDASKIIATVDGKRVQIYSAHAYTIKSVDDKNVYLINPHDTSKTIQMSLKEYQSNFNLLAIADLSSLPKK